MQNLKRYLKHSWSFSPGIASSLSCMFFCLLLVMGVQAQENTQGVIFSGNEKWENVLQRAKQQDKLIFMDCYTSWCGPCKALAKDVFTQREVGDFFNSHFINVKYDMETGVGKELKKIYEANIVAYPTLLLINKEGKVVQRLVGYQDAEQLLKGVKDGMEGRSVFSYRWMYESGNRDLVFLKTYVTALENAYCQEEARQVAMDYMHSIPVERLKDREVWELVRPYLDDAFSPQFEFVMCNMVNYWLTLGEDRYKLERQMEEAIKQAVEYITGKNWDENKQELPLINEPEKVEKLRGYLNRESFPGGHLLKLKLRIHELKLAQRWEDVYTYLTVCRDAGILAYSDHYINESIEYVAQYVTEPALLERCFKLVEELQVDGDKTGKKLFKTNFYGTLALLHEKLGHKKEAADCKVKCEALQKEAKEIYERLSKHE